MNSGGLGELIAVQAASTYSRDRCVTGIHGLDEILRGGIPYGSTVLASGTCGSGKTTLGMEFLVRGALAGEACAHFTATEPSVKLLENIRQYAFFDMNMVDTGLINVFDMDVLYSWLGLDKSTFDLDDVHALIKSITDIVNTIGVTRLVIDSVTTLCYKIKSEQLIRDFLFTLGKKLATLGCTTILISEITSATENATGPPSVLKKRLQTALLSWATLSVWVTFFDSCRWSKCVVQRTVEPSMLLNSRRLVSC